MVSTYGVSVLYTYVLNPVTLDESANPEVFANVNAYELLIPSPIMVEFVLIELSNEAVVDRSCPCVIEDA
jgi:hypothetical protein